MAANHAKIVAKYTKVDIFNNQVRITVIKADAELKFKTRLADNIKNIQAKIQSASNLLYSRREDCDSMNDHVHKLALPVLKRNPKLTNNRNEMCQIYVIEHVRTSKFVTTYIE